MEEGDNCLLIKFSDVAKLGGVANPAESQTSTQRNLEMFWGVQVEDGDVVTIGNKDVEEVIQKVGIVAP